jgi:dipeptidyl-peptidase-4
MRRIFLFILAGACVTALTTQSSGQELTLEAIFAPNGITGRVPDSIKWSPDGKEVSYMVHAEQGEQADLYYIDVATAKPAVLVGSAKIAAMTPRIASGKDDRERDNRARYHVASYHWTPDSAHILFDANGQLWYYTLATGTSVQMTASSDASGDPKFSPDGQHLSYVRKHNLVVRRVEGGNEKELTNEKNQDLLNGEVDWVYAEELDVRSNYFWSPDGSKIVFLQMNEAKVPTYPIVDFIPQHPTVFQEKYPKVGDPNPEVRLGVVSSDGGKTKWIHLTDEKDLYVPRFGWVRNGVAWAQVLNRAQNQLDLYFFDVESGKSRRVLSEKSDTWIEVEETTFLKSGDKFIWPSWRDGHTHLYLYSFDQNNPLGADAKLVNQITKGDFEVFNVEGIDENSSTVYFTSNAGDDRERHLSSVKLDGSSFQVLTKDQPGTHEASLSPDGKYYIDHFSAVMTPPQLSFCGLGSPGKCDVFFQSKSIDAYKLQPPEFVDFKAEDGTVLHGLIYLPPLESSRKAPLLNNPYGGPHGQVVRNQWGRTDFLFNELLAREGIAVLQVDNRGMGSRGKKFAAALMHNFGEVELKDQLAAIDQALQKYPFLDGSRLGWWGWSYGGFMTLNAMTHSDRFVAGVSVAPVTDWHDYDSIYTERYEGLVPENEAAYRKSSPVNFAGQLHGHLLEVHGTSDDNVHMQNTMQMINGFINSGKQFDLQLYPRKTHGIAGPGTRVHLFTRIREHFRRELLRESASPRAQRANVTKIASDVAEANLAHKVNPVYPETPRIAHVQGDVVLDAFVDKLGNVTALKTVAGHPLLIAPAIEAVKQWTYKPFLLNGEPVDVETTITIRFHM